MTGAAAPRRALRKSHRQFAGAVRRLAPMRIRARCPRRRRRPAPAARRVRAGGAARRASTPPPSERRRSRPLAAPSEDVVLTVTAVATAATGGADITLIVHRAGGRSMRRESERARAATSTWCAGEVDDEVVCRPGLHVHDRRRRRRRPLGDWPAIAAAMQFAAVPRATVATDGDLGGRRRPSCRDGRGRPHCALQPRSADRPGSGHLYLGLAGDVDGDGDGTPAFGGWAKSRYGINSPSRERQGGGRPQRVRR